MTPKSTVPEHLKEQQRELKEAMAAHRKLEKLIDERRKDDAKEGDA